MTLQPACFEALRPLDVVALVETGAQLEQRRDLLAVLGGGDQGLGQARLAGQAVQRDLDGDDRSGSMAASRSRCTNGIHGSRRGRTA